MTSFISWLYGTWEAIPAGVRAGIAAVVVALVSAGLAFGWSFPSNWADALKEVSAFWLVAGPVAWQVFQKSLWPPLFAWLLTLIGLEPTTDARLLVAVRTR
jgi:hypothetical protein